MSRRILVADDHPMCSAALAMAARAVLPDAAVTVVATLAEAETAARAGAYDLILLDLMLPDVQGFAGLAMLRTLRPASVIAVVSGREEMTVVRQAMALGARGFIRKSSAMDAMIAAIRVLLDGGTWFPDGTLDGVADDRDLDVTRRIGELSTAQLRVLRAAATGRQTKQLAYELNLSEPTIKTHLAAVFRKLGVTNRTQAILALRQLEPEADTSEPA